MEPVSWLLGMNCVLQGKRDGGRGASPVTWNENAPELTCPFRGSVDKLTPLPAGGTLYTHPHTHLSCLSMQNADGSKQGSRGSVGRTEGEKNQVRALRVHSQALNTNPGHSPFNTPQRLGYLCTPRTSQRAGAEGTQTCTGVLVGGVEPTTLLLQAPVPPE